MVKVVLEELSCKYIYENIFESLKTIFTGFVFAFIIAIFLALIIYEYKILNRIIYPILEILRPIPNAGWVPISIMICSTINQSMILITFIGAFFPMFITIYRALQDIPKNYIYISKLYKLKLKHKVISIIIPSILPNIFTSLMLGISGAWLSVIMAEMISGQVGIGYYTWENYTLLEYEKVYLGIIIMGVIGCVLSRIFSLISKKYIHWNGNGV